MNWLQEEERAQENAQRDKSQSEREYEQRNLHREGAATNGGTPNTSTSSGRRTVPSSGTPSHSGILRRLEPDVIPEPTTAFYTDATTSTNADVCTAAAPSGYGEEECITTPNVKDMRRLFSGPGGRPLKKG